MIQTRITQNPTLLYVLSFSVSLKLESCRVYGEGSIEIPGSTHRAIALTMHYLWFNLIRFIVLSIILVFLNQVILYLLASQNTLWSSAVFFVFVFFLKCEDN